MNAPRPVTVIGGFLGAGKTTLLNHWLAQAGGERLAVLVNDFGAVAVDAALVRARGADAVALSNGCVCCSIGDDLGSALDHVLAADPPFDAVVVEASGVADPWRIAQYAIADPRLRLRAVLVLVDAAALAAQAADARLVDTLVRGVAHADLVLLNKADVARADGLAAARAWVACHAPTAPVLETVDAALPVSALDETRYMARGGDPPMALHRSGLAATTALHHADRFEAWSSRPAGRFDADSLRRWAQALPPGVLRLKALLPMSDGRWIEVQLAGRRASLRAMQAVPHGAPADGAMAVAIGLRGELPSDALEAGLAACLAHNDRRPSEVDR